MSFEKFNHWLTLGANLGVLVGLIFLILEINQSNRIADRDSRVDVLRFRIDIGSFTFENLENADLMAKLRSDKSELSPAEEEIAFQLANSYMALWAAINASIENGLMSDTAVEVYKNGAVNLIRRYPGFEPFMNDVFTFTGVGENTLGPIAEAARLELQSNH